MSGALPIDIGTLRIREFTDVSQIGPKVDKARTVAEDGPLSLAIRKQQLRNLFYAIIDNMDLLCSGLEVDLHRPNTQTKLLELGIILDEIKLAIDNVDQWAAARKTDFDIKYFASGPKIVPEPYGLVLVIGPWNYPYLCSIAPIVNAIAAGNCVVLKPSEMTPTASEIMIRVLESALDPHIFTAITGAIPESTELLAQKFDKICFTGSPNVGKVVSSAAAKHLTPVLLELGGKCPSVVDSTADLALAARRIVWGKFVNAGQTCVAPDYIIVEKEVTQQLLSHINAEIRTQYPNLSKDTYDFTHIVNERLWTRADKLVKSSKGRVDQHGTPDKQSLFYPPTIVSGVLLDDSLMQEELFAPILPVISVDSIYEAVPLIKNHDTPLASYVFSLDRKVIENIQTVRSGAVFINDVVMQAGCSKIPFGGIGNSGSGAYHGKVGFDSFSHLRPILSQPSYIESFLSIRYPPYTSGKQSIVAKASIPLGAWFPREGPVRAGILRRLLSKSWLVALIVGFFWYYRK